MPCAISSTPRAGPRLCQRLHAIRNPSLLVNQNSRGFDIRLSSLSLDSRDLNACSTEHCHRQREPSWPLFHASRKRFDDTRHFSRELIFIEVATEKVVASQVPRIKFQDLPGRSLLPTSCRGISNPSIADQWRGCHSHDEGVKTCCSDLKHGPFPGLGFSKR